MKQRFFRVALMLAIMLVTMAGLTALTAHGASAQFGCFGSTETFETWTAGSNGLQAPPGWMVTNDYSGSPIIWHSNTVSPTRPVINQGNYAVSVSWPEYSGYLYDTSLVTPVFSTVGMREVRLSFYLNYQWWNYDRLDVDYRIGAGSWVNVRRYNSDVGTYYGAGALQTLNFDATRGNSQVQIRWRYYNITSNLDYYVGVDTASMVCAVDAAAVEELPVTFGDPDEVCNTGIGTLMIEVVNTGTAPLVNRAGQPEFSVTVNSDNGAPVSILSITSGVGPGQIPGAAPMGGSATADLDIPIGGSDRITVRIGFPRGIGNTGGLFVDRSVWIDFTNFGVIDRNLGELIEFFGAEEDPIEIPCLPTVDPNRQLGMQVHLPILTFKGQDSCDVWIEVQNIGPEPVKAVLITWGEAGFCPPQAAGPLKVECTGLLMPGTTWNMLGDQIPDGSKSGMLFKFSTKQLSDYGLDEIFGFDDIFADLMCETLFFGVVGDADDFRRFKKAYNEHGTFAGIPMDLAQGLAEGGILAVDVLRTCDADKTAGAKVTSKYNGIAGSHLGTYDPVYGGYTYYVPLIFAQRSEFNTWVYIQNGGLECSSVEIWMKAQDDCLRARICEVSTLAPGETYQFDPAQCVNVQPGAPGTPGGWLGSAWIRTSQPMGVAVDIWGRDVLMTYVGEPGELNYTFDPSQALASPGNQVAFGPLIYSEYQGWETGIQVQNLSPIVAAKVKVYFLDRGGDVITTLVDWICPRGSQSFFLPVVHNLPGNWVGSVRVESQEWLTPGGPRVMPPNIVGVATLMKYADVQKSETQEAIAYNLLPEHKIYDWQIGYGGGGLDSGIGLIAIPSLLADLDGTGVTSELAIANVVPKPGFTDFAIFIYDQNGLLDYVCQKLNEKQVEYIDLNSWGYINNGFKGSAIISAYFWEHDVFASDGRFLRNLVGLGAVAIERSRVSLGTVAPGDEAAGARGIPFRRSDIEDEEFDFGFMGEPIICPGLPDNRFGEGGEGADALRCPPGAINGTFNQGSPDWDDYDSWTVNSRIFRDGVPSQCGPKKACPTQLAMAGGYLDAYYFDNPGGGEACITVNVTHTCGVNAMVYAVTGRMPNGQGWTGTCPIVAGVDYLGDVGQSGSPETMSFTIPAGLEHWTLIFENVSGPQACTYSATISGFDCQ